MAVWLTAALAGTAGAMPLLGPQDVKTDGMKVTIGPFGPHERTVEIAPLEVLHGEATMTVSGGTANWAGPNHLPKVAWIYRAMKPGSLVVTLAEEPKTKLAEKTDYLLDADWATVAAVASSTMSGKPWHFTYDYTLSRLDLIEKTADGKVMLKPGKADKNEPLLPETSPGATALASVYLPPNTTMLTASNINLIDPAYNGVPAVSRAETLKAVREKLKAGKPVTIVFFGDSITAQTAKDTRDGRGSFVDRFAKYLETAYPQSKVIVTPTAKPVKPQEREIVVVKAGVGGNDTVMALKRIDKDVLAHQADAVVIMFGLNDENGTPGKNSVPVDKYRANLGTIVEKIRGAGSEPVLMTTSMKNLAWEATAGNLNEYAAAAREVAKERRVCLVDNFEAWQNAPKRGYNYMIYLNTCINHPGDLGHELFFQGLKTALEGK
jgi:lysophospholipase L1-like esterase